MGWWWELGYEDGCTPDSIIRFGSEVYITSIHKEEKSYLCVDSLINWCEPNFDELFFIALASIVVIFTPVTWFCIKTAKECY